MKTLRALAALLAVTLAGCAGQPPARTSNQQTPLHPNGTDVGTSFPGVNQGVPPTTATASSDSR